MKIVICGSIAFTHEMKQVADQLVKLGHAPELPLTSRRILGGELTLEEFKKQQDAGEGPNRKIKDDVIRAYYRKIEQADAILVLNLEKNGVPNYVGGNTFLEIGFAHVLNKRIYLYNEIPAMPHTDEIMAMQPTVLKGNLALIR